METPTRAKPRQEIDQDRCGRFLENEHMADTPVGLKLDESPKSSNRIQGLGDEPTGIIEAIDQVEEGGL